MSELTLTADGVRKSYSSGSTTTPVLKGVDLTIGEGECVFLAGPSGSGKSTLLSILGCVLSPDAGEIELLGQRVSRLSHSRKARFRRYHIGFVFQRYQLFSGLSALENVTLRLHMVGIRGRAAVDEAHRLIEAVGLKTKATSPIQQLSMGQRQRIALARALAGEPELILADEPTASLDAESGQTAMKLLRELAKEKKKTVVVVTHDNRIFPMADRILHLKDGEIANETSDVAESVPLTNRG